MSDEIREEKSERGFTYLDEVATDYGATVRFYESSACMIEGENRGPWMWMACEQPPPQYPGALKQELGSVHVHMDLKQAEEIYARLGRMIEITKQSWGIE